MFRHLKKSLENFTESTPRRILVLCGRQSNEHLVKFQTMGLATVSLATNFLDISRKFLEIFRIFIDISRKFLEISRTFLDISRTCVEFLGNS